MIFPKFPDKKKVELPVKAKKEAPIVVRVKETKERKAVNDCQKIGELVTVFLQQNLSFPKKGTSFMTEQQIQFFNKGYDDNKLAQFLIVLQNPDFKTNLETQDKPIITLKKAFEVYQKVFTLQSNDVRQREDQEVAFIVSLVSLPIASRQVVDQNDVRLANRISTTFLIYEKLLNSQWFSLSYEVLQEYLLQFQKNIRLSKRIKSHFQKMKRCKLNNLIVAAAQFDTIISQIQTFYIQWVNSILAKNFDKKNVIKLLTNLNGCVGRIISRLGNQIIVDVIDHFVQQISRPDSSPQQVLNKYAIFLREGGGIYTSLDSKQKKNDIVSAYNKPSDFKHLMRNVLIKRLSTNSNMVVRQFLSTDTTKIFITIKANHQIIKQEYTKYSILNETELGAVDLFSLQPVDQAKRPLRLNIYLRDVAFIKNFQFLRNFNGRKELLKEQEQSVYQNRLQSDYSQIQKFNEDELRVECIKSQLIADVIFEELSQQIYQSYIKPTNIIDEIIIEDRVVWEAYLIYLKLIIYLYNKIKPPKSRKNMNKAYFVQKEFQDVSGMIYRLMFNRALVRANQTINNHVSFFNKLSSCRFGQLNVLKNIWDLIKIPPFSPYIPYMSSKNLFKLWRKIERNEVKQRTAFKDSDTIILINTIITKNINIYQANKLGITLDYYPCHDPYTLRGIEIRPYLSRLRSDKEKESNENRIRILNILNSFQEFSWENDFSSKSIEELASFDFTNSTDVPLLAINNYLGNKIALMLSFIQQFIRSMKWMIPISFILQIMLWATTTSYATGFNIDLKSAVDSITIFLSFMVVIWSSSLISNWQKQEEIYRIKYGTERIEQSLNQRLQYKGKYIRNLVSDNPNFLEENKLKKAFRLVVTAVINFGFIILTVFAIVLIFLLKKFMIKLNCCSESIVSNVPTILISVSIIFFNKLYSVISQSLTIYQNHKLHSQYENSKIFNTYLIEFMNNFNSLFIFAFFQSYFNDLRLCDIQISQFETVKDCSFYVGNQMLSTFIVNLMLNISQVFKPIALFILNKINTKPNPDNRFIFNELQSIDHFYQQQEMLTSYRSDSQLDGTLRDYMVVIVNISYILFFGLSLPVCFIIATISNVIYLHSLKIKLLFLVKRPLPSKVANIGFWKIILEFISMAGILCNIFYIVYTRKAFKENSVIALILLLLAMLIVKYMFSGNQTNEYFQQIVMRHKQSVSNFILKASKIATKKIQYQGILQSKYEKDEAPRQKKKGREIKLTQLIEKKPLLRSSTLRTVVVPKPSIDASVSLQPQEQQNINIEMPAQSDRQLLQAQRVDE